MMLYAQQVKMSRQKYYFLSIFLCVLVVIILYNLSMLPVFNQYNYVREYQKTSSAVRGTRSILLWNDFFGKKHWDLPADTLGPEFFRENLKCPIYACEITNNRNFLPSIDMFDAILFHVAEPFPIIERIPNHRKVQQLYVFALMEPPGETKHDLSDEKEFYNLTMTYRLDSDIVWPYKYVFDSKTNAIVAPAKHPKWREPPIEFNDTEIHELWENKTKLVAWFVSHCDTLSNREKMVKELKKYVSIDVYGKCGDLDCPYTSEMCDVMLDQNYKFYLAFENALCTDYVTEKLFNALKRQVIPIVFGGADYSRIHRTHFGISQTQYNTKIYKNVMF